jgi:outer membrane protein assembly factor BamA
MLLKTETSTNRIIHMNKLKYIAPVLIAVACFGLQQAKATITYDLTNPNSAISGFPAPYGSVSVTLVGSTATIVFTAAAHDGFQYLFGDGSTAAVNVNGAFTLGAITGTHLAGFGFHTGEGYSNGGSGQVDGFGSFNLTINSDDGYTRSSNSVTFTLTGSFADEAHVLIANANGSIVAAHIFVAAFPADPNAGALATGFASNGGAVNTPDGGTTVMLLGAALGVLGMARRFIRS